MPSFPSDYRTQSNSTLVLLREVLQAALTSGNLQSINYVLTARSVAR
jgi:hypothetical protein